MNIAYFIKTSLVDYDGYMASVVFTQGCNMHCSYCHNKELEHVKNLVSEDEVFNHLKKRRGLIEGVVITGGEPTLQNDLMTFILQVKHLGYKVKLDTNGTDPHGIEALLEQDLLDLVALDIKTTPSLYEALTGYDFNRVKQTLDILRNSNTSYEIRTTAYPKISLSDLEILCQTYKNENYFLQQYRQYDVDDMKPYEDSELLDLGQRYGVKLRHI